MVDNKRRFTRIPFNADTRLTVGVESYRMDRIYNLSIGGCLLPLGSDLTQAAPLRKGMLCEIKIVLSEVDDQLNVEVSGQIIRHEDDMVAVKFTRIDPESLFHLRNIVRYNAPDTRVVEKEIEKHPGII